MVYTAHKPTQYNPYEFYRKIGLFSIELGEKRHFLEGFWRVLYDFRQEMPKRRVYAPILEDGAMRDLADFFLQPGGQTAFGHSDA